MTGPTIPRALGRDADCGNAARQYVSFRVDAQLLGVPVQAVQEVLNPQTIAPVPRARPEIAGLLNLRGQIVTAIDLRTRLGMPPRSEYAARMNVVVRHGGESYSLLVDEVGDVIEIDAERLDPPPGTLDSRWKSVTRGVFRLEKSLFVLLNVPAVLGMA